MENQDSKRFIHYAGSLFLVIASVAIVWQIFGPTWYKNIRAEVTSQPYARTVTVDAEGKITAKPDIAVVNFSVVSQGATVQEVTTEGNAKMNAVLAKMEELGIEDKDLMTSQYSLYPRYSDKSVLEPTPLDSEGRIKVLSVEDDSQRIVGYNLDQSLQVKVRKLDQVEEILDASVESGANQIGQLYFEIDDPSLIKQQAREKAFKTAHEKAEQMASAAGVKLGRVVTFSEGGNYYPGPYANYAMESKQDASSVSGPSIAPGSQEINLTVSVTYEIE